MEEQREYARLLHSSGHGIALRQPTHDIDVGDICYWSAQGKALRILNVFDNKDWLAQNNWPALNITRDKIIDKSENNNLQVIHGGGINWTITNQYNYGFEIMFSRTGNDTAICMPAGPCTITGLRASGKHHIEQWWLRAKRHAFHTWAHLLNDPTGIFLVIKTVKTARYASCLSHGNPGQVSQIRVHGTMKIPRGNEDLDIPINGTQLFPIKNELSMDLYETERRGDFTIFMERDSSFMFRLGEGQMKEAAQKYWEYDPVVNCINGSACIPKNTNQTPLTNQWGAPAPAWGGGISVNWPQPNLAPPAAQPARPSSPATFDGQDRITISEGWFLIRGDGCFFLEHAGTGLDLPVKEITMANLMKLLKLPDAPAPPAPAQPPPPVIAPLPQGPFPMQWGQQPGPGPMGGGQQPMGGGQVPMGAPVPMGNPPIPQVNPPIPQMNLPLPVAPAHPNPPPPLGYNANPQMPFNPAMMPMPMPAPNFPNPMQAAALAHPPQGFPPPMMMQPMQHPIPMPAPHMQMQMPPPQMPGIAHISPPLGGNVMAGAVFGTGLTPLPLPEIKDGRPVESVLPSYAGFNLTTTGNGPPTLTIKPGGNPSDVPWGWN